MVGKVWCVLSAVPRWGQRLGATIVVTGFVVTCCMFCSVGFVVVMSVVIICMVCVVPDFVDTVIKLKFLVKIVPVLEEYRVRCCVVIIDRWAGAVLISIIDIINIGGCCSHRDIHRNVS